MTEGSINHDTRTLGQDFAQNNRKKCCDGKYDGLVRWRISAL